MNNNHIWNAPLESLLGSAAEGKEQFEQHEVLELLNIKPYQLRFWESEFDIIRPVFSTQGANYSQKDLKILLRIKNLLLEKQLTVEKVKAMLDLELSNLENVVPQTLEIQQVELEANLNMNALFSEMSMETFQVSQETHTPLSVEAEKLNQLSAAIAMIKKKFKEQFKS